MAARLCRHVVLDMPTHGAQASRCCYASTCALRPACPGAKRAATFTMLALLVITSCAGQGMRDLHTSANIWSVLCSADHVLHTEEDTIQVVTVLVHQMKHHCTQLGLLPNHNNHSYTANGTTNMVLHTATKQQAMRKLLQNVIVPGNPLDRTFAGYASDFDILAVLTVALNALQNPDIAGRNNSANAARVFTFKGARFPFGVNFAVTNTFGAKTKGTMDLTARSNRHAAIADGATDMRSIAFPIVGDVQAVQGLISTAISQIELQQSPQPSPRPRNITVPRIPQDPKFIPKYVVSTINVTTCLNGQGRPTGQVQVQVPQQLGRVPGNLSAPCVPVPGPPVQNLGTIMASNATIERGKGQQGLANQNRPALPAMMGPRSSLVTQVGPTGDMDMSMKAAGPVISTKGFGNISVAGDRTGYKAYTPPDRFHTQLDHLDYMYYTGTYNDKPFEWPEPGTGTEPWRYDYVDPYFYIEYEDDPASWRNSSAATDFRTGGQQGIVSSNNRRNQTGGDYFLRQPTVTNLPPFQIFLATSLDYGRAGQYAYFYTNYFRFLYTYYFGPSVIPATSLTRSRTTSYAKREERGSAAGEVQSEATGQDVAGVVNSVSAATGNAITQSIAFSDIFGNDTFTGPPQLLTRYAGAQAAAVAFGRSYYYSQPAVALSSASSQANVNQGYAAGGGAGFTSYSSGSQFSGTRGQVLAGTGEVNLDWDVGG